MKMSEIVSEVMKEVDKKFYERDYKLEALKQAFQGHNREIGELFDFLKDLKEKMLFAIKMNVSYGLLIYLWILLHGFPMIKAHWI